MTERRVSIGLDIGGTKIAGGLLDETGALTERRVVRTEATGGGEAVLRKMLDLIETLSGVAVVQGRSLIGVGVASPGIVEIETVTVRYASNNIPGWSGTAIGPAIWDRFGLPSWADNDASLALVGELFFGAGRGAKGALMVTLGTGVGGAVAVDGRILRGANGVAGKFGHIPLTRSGPLCSCGRRGCVEAYASGTAVVRAARRSFGFSGTGEQLQVLAEAGDERARQVFTQAGERLGMALASAANLLDPGLCLIGGGLAAAGELLFEPARAVMMAKCHPQIAGHTRLVPASLGADAGLLGAAYLPWQPSILGGDGG